ncbi:hypothetical protein SAMN05444372_112119 [Flavobacterium micromati]|uniref:Uncharacterized protein n=1 Tax=Flavobacterium micromati TaxID=229205 RepID=A0A1M5P9U5_9FLAO|nr:hypothetical protein [Flavobacterium micromati]SHG98538.1 hypothetical protein SAMN05444372_112119 [Flavobacterium micromati]
MSTKYKVLLIIIAPIFFIIVSYLTFIYFFTKEPNPIESYTFSMSYNELEKRVDREMLNHINLKKSTVTADQTRYVTLGKDSYNYFFTTNLNENQSKKYDGAWIELVGILDSNLKRTDISYDNRDKYRDKIKIFEDDFINKIKNKKR